MLDDPILDDLGDKLFSDLIRNSIKRIRQRKDGTTQEEVNFKVGLSKQLIDQVDQAMAQHYGFTDEQLDYIINYDIKYRAGKEADSDD